MQEKETFEPKNTKEQGEIAKPMKTNMAISSQEREHIKNSRIFVKGG